MAIHPSADVAASANVHPEATVWHYAQLRAGASVGACVVVGRGVYIGTGVSVGANSKIQNYALIYEPAEIETGVFIGPAVVLTNDRNPRAIDPEGHQKSADDWHAVGVRIREGASIGARAVCVAPLTVGRWAMVAAGAVVTADVPDFALVAGTPARRIGWVGRSGFRLVEAEDEPGRWVCPNTGRVYVQVDDTTLQEAGFPPMKFRTSTGVVAAPGSLGS